MYPPIERSWYIWIRIHICLSREQERRLLRNWLTPLQKLRSPQGAVIPLETQRSGWYNSSPKASRLATQEEPMIQFPTEDRERFISQLWSVRQKLLLALEDQSFCSSWAFGASDGVIHFGEDHLLYSV